MSDDNSIQLFLKENGFSDEQIADALAITNPDSDVLKQVTAYKSAIWEKVNSAKSINQEDVDTAKRLLNVLTENNVRNDFSMFLQYMGISLS